MLQLLIDSPVSFINTVTPLASFIVIFCAVGLPWITIVWVLIYLGLRHQGNRIRAFFIVCASAVIADGASILLKNYFKIGRPAVLNFNLHPLLPIADYGFPSSHAAVFSAIAGALFFINRKAGILAALLALAIGIARIFAGVHTPLDILGGYLLGTFVAALVDFIVQKI